jgi:ABC-2 type transport system permease protein
MNSSVAAVYIKRFHSPETVIGRFIAKRTVKAAAFWALVFGGFLASKAIGFVQAYPTALGREKAVATFSNNIGVNVLLGPAPHAGTVPGYAAWSTLNAMVMIGAIWAFLLATKTLRGEEDAGRWELLLSGQTTARRAITNALTGLWSSLTVFFVVSVTAFAAVGNVREVGFGIGSAAFFGLAVLAGPAMFLMVGALMSQLMPTRSRAAGVSAAIFGVSFLLRAVADSTSAHWLQYLTPFGWIEKLQPLSDNKPLWLLPIAGSILLLGALTIFFAGRRDLGDSIFADKDTAKPHLRLLGSPFSAAIRLTRANSLSWLAAIGISATLYGFLTKSAAQVFDQSASSEHILNSLVHQSKSSGYLAFLGVIFFLQMTLIMTYAASSVAAMRRDEAEGYLDNLLVRPVSRQRWLWGRVLLTTIVILSAGLLTSLGTWLGIFGQHTGISFHTLILASANVLIPVAFVVGLGVFTLGLRPRLTSLAVYGVIAWSFMIEMVSSGINLNHWVLDTSILHHIVLAPAASPNWSRNVIIIIISIILCIIGAISFSQRDLSTE